MSVAMVRLFVQRDDEDGQVLDVPPRQVLLWEEAFPNRSMRLLDGDAVRLEYLYELAWVVLGKPGELKAFKAGTDVAFVVEVEQPKKKGGADGELDPTPKAPRTGSSSTSRARRASRSGSGGASSSAIPE